jgi:hypothetical protein
MKFEFRSKFLNSIESKLSYLDWSQLHAIYNFLLFLSSVVVCNSTKHKLIHTLTFTKKERKKERIYKSRNGKEKRNGSKKGLNIHSYIQHKTYILLYIYIILYELFIYTIHLYIITLFYTYNLWDLKMWRLVVERHDYYPKQNCKKVIFYYHHHPHSPTHLPSKLFHNSQNKTKQILNLMIFFHTRIIVI